MKKTNRLIDKVGPYAQKCAPVRKCAHDQVERPSRSRVYAFPFLKGTFTCSHPLYYNTPATGFATLRLFPYTELTEANHGRRASDITLRDGLKRDNVQKFPAIRGKGAILADEGRGLTRLRQRKRQEGEGIFSKNGTFRNISVYSHVRRSYL